MVAGSPKSTSLWILTHKGEERPTLPSTSSKGPGLRPLDRLKSWAGAREDPLEPHSCITQHLLSLVSTGSRWARCWRLSRARQTSRGLEETCLHEVHLLVREQDK